MTPFKFLNNRNTYTTYDGQMSREVIRYLRDYIEGYFYFLDSYERITDIAKYKIYETDNSHGGTMTSAKVTASPLNDPSIFIIFDIDTTDEMIITNHRIIPYEEV